MAITYSWSFGAAQTATVGALTKVITEVSYTLLATDGVNTVTYGDSVKLPPPDPAKFTPFASVDRPTVINWVSTSAGFDLAGKQAMLATRLASAPVGVTPVPLPFGS